MKRVILTGATSMLGIALINECVGNNIEVLAVVRPGSINKNRIPNSNLVHVVECGLQSIEVLKNYTAKKYDVFYHFGWEATEKKNRNDVFLQNLNVNYTLESVKVAKQMGCRMFVGAGSQAEYGVVSHKISPETPTYPNTAYGIAKYTAGKLSAILSKELGIEHIWARIFSVYGIYDNSETMIMDCIDKLLRKEKAMFTPCEQVWDYLYSEDAGRAFKLIGEKGKDQSIYCVGSGKARPLYEYVNIIRDSIDRNLDIGIGMLEYTPNQVMYLCADIANLKQDTGFEARIEFEDGIDKILKWYDKNYRVTK